MSPQPITCQWAAITDTHLPVSAVCYCCHGGFPASTLRRWPVVGSSVDLSQATLRHPSCPDVGDSGSLWHRIKCPFQFNRGFFVGGTLSRSTSSAKTLPQMHKIPPPSSFKKTLILTLGAALHTPMHQILMNNNVNTHNVPHEKYLTLFYL